MLGPDTGRAAIRKEVVFFFLEQNVWTETTKSLSDSDQIHRVWRQADNIVNNDSLVIPYRFQEGKGYNVKLMVEEKNT